MEINQHELREWVGEAISDARAEGIPTKYPLSWEVYKCRILAGGVAILTMGGEWLEKHIMPFDRPSAYFKADYTDEISGNRFQMRVIELGDLLYNLHRVEGFEDRIAMIRSDDRGVEGGISELIAGRFFQYRGVPFKFRPTTGTKGQDYDVEYTRTDGTSGRCEIEAKLQTTEFSSNTIHNSLKHGKDQLPKGESGIVFLRTPEEWLTDQDELARLQAILTAVDEWFAKEKTSRVSSVVLGMSRTEFIGSNMRTLWVFRDCPNPHSRFSSGLPIECVNEYGHAVKLGSWTTMDELVKEWYSDCAGLHSANPESIRNQQERK